MGIKEVSFDLVGNLHLDISIVAIVVGTLVVVAAAAAAAVVVVAMVVVVAINNIGKLHLVTSVDVADVAALDAALTVDIATLDNVLVVDNIAIVHIVVAMVVHIVVHIVVATDRVAIIIHTAGISSYGGLRGLSLLRLPYHRLDRVAWIQPKGIDQKVRSFANGFFVVAYLDNINA